MSEPIRILIVDDHTIVRDGLQALLSAEPGMQVVGVGANGVEAVEKARALRPDIILLDLILLLFEDSIGFEFAAANITVCCGFEHLIF